MSSMHISFLRLWLAKEQRQTPGGLSRKSQPSSRDLIRRRLKSCMRKKCSVLLKHETSERQATVIPGDIWSQAKTEIQPWRVQGQRYLQVSWMHPGLTQLQASCHLLQLLLISGVPGWAETTFLCGKAAWGTSQPFQGLGVPWEQCCSCVCWETALKKVMRKLQLVHQQQCLVGRNEDISIVLSHNNMV